MRTHVVVFATILLGIFCTPLRAEEPPKKDLLMRAFRGTELGPWMDVNQFSISGYGEVTGSLTTNGDRRNPRQWSDRLNGVRLNSVGIKLQRSISDANPWDWGFTIMPTYGTDVSLYSMGGPFADGPWGHQRHYAHYDVPLCSAEGKGTLGGGVEIFVQGGRFGAPIGLEPLFIPDNPFPLVSRSVIWGASPFTSIGGIGTVRFWKMLSLKGGCMTMDRFRIDDQHLFGYAGWEFKPFDELSFAGNFLLGQYLEIYNLVLQGRIGPFGYGLDGQVSWSKVRHAPDHRALGGAVYLGLEVIDHLQLLARGEYWDDPHGARTGISGRYFGLAVGPSYDVVIANTMVGQLALEGKWVSHFTRSGNFGRNTPDSEQTAILGFAARLFF